MANTKLKEQLINLNQTIKLETNDVNSVVKKIKKISDQCKRKFEESVDITMAITLNKKENTSVRGFCDLPKGHGRKVKILVFAEGKMAEVAKAAGAEIVGGTELITKIKNNEFKIDKKVFNRCIAVESMMKDLTKIAQMLGGKKIMPNKKDGTIILDNEEILKKTIQNIKHTTVFFKNDSHGYIRTSVGRVSFSEEDLVDNINSVLNTVSGLSVSKNQKGNPLKNISLSTTMGINIPISL